MKIKLGKVIIKIPKFNFINLLIFSCIINIILVVITNGSKSSITLCKIQLPLVIGLILYDLDIITIN